MTDYKEIAELLYNAYKASDCGNYMVERVKKLYYGMMVKDNIPKFLAVYDVLVANGHDAKNPYVYGDMDQGVWYEKSPDEITKIIATERYCSCADDNTHIFILKDFGWDQWFNEKHKVKQEDYRFSCMTAWPRQKNNSKKHHQWGDHRDIEHPSINTYRKHKFKFGYEDGRDEGYSFNYETITGNVEDAHWKESRILYALDILNYDYEAMVNNYAEYKCN